MIKTKLIFFITVTRLLDQGKAIDIVFLDFSIAFDSVSCYPCGQHGLDSIFGRIQSYSNSSH